MRNTILFFILLFVYLPGKAQDHTNDTQGTILKTDDFTVTVYAKPVTSFSNAPDINLNFAVSIEGTSGPGPISAQSHIGGVLTAAPVEIFGTRRVYPYTLSSAGVSMTAGMDNQIATVVFPETVGQGTMIQLNDYTGSGANQAYWYISHSGGDQTPYDALFYGANSNNVAGGDSYVELNAPLPVTLVSFNAEKHQTRSSLLSWSTASEINSSHFLVQRSTDKKEWKTVGKINAAGESQIIRNYNFVDENVYNGFDASLIVYYRLMSVDLDGQTKGSPIEAVVFGNSDIAIGRNFVAYPNPASDGIHVAWNADIADQPTDIEFYDTNGKQVYTHQVGENSHEEYVDFTKTNLQAGLYLMRVMSGNDPVEFKQIVIGQK